MLKRYIGPESPVTVVIAGEEFGVIETGESLAIPDDLANSVAWSERNWEDGSIPKTDKTDEGGN